MKYDTNLKVFLVQTIPRFTVLVIFWRKGLAVGRNDCKTQVKDNPYSLQFARRNDFAR